jgi:hypothetical protein
VGTSVAVDARNTLFLLELRRYWKGDSSIVDEKSIPALKSYSGHGRLDSIVDFYLISRIDFSSP